MRSIPRVVALVLLAGGALVSLVAMIAIFVKRGSLPTEEEARAWSALERGFALVVYSRLGVPAALALGGGAIVGGILLFLAIKRKPWAMLVIAIAAAASIVVVWMAQGVVAKMEDPRYRDESRYVRAATGVAWTGTAYFAALAASAGIAYVMARRSALPPTQAAGTIDSGGPA